MAIKRCLHDKNFYNAEWKKEVKKDFLIFVERLFNNSIKAEIEENNLETIKYCNLEDAYIMWLKSNGCFDWEDDDKKLENDEYCEGTYEDEIYSVLDSLVADINMEVKNFNDLKGVL